MFLQSNQSQICKADAMVTFLWLIKHVYCFFVTHLGFDADIFQR